MHMLHPVIPTSGEFRVTDWQEITAPSMISEAVTGRTFPDAVIGRFEDVQDGDTDPYLYVARHARQGRVRAWLATVLR